MQLLPVDDSAVSPKIPATVYSLPSVYLDLYLHLPLSLFY